MIINKPFEKITVQDIMEEAMISRSTFYQHFRDKYEIVEQLQVKYIEELMRISGDIRIEKPAQLDEINKIMHSYFIENRSVLRAMLSIKTEHVDIVKQWQELFKQSYIASVNSPTVKTEASAYAGMIVGCITSYLESDEISTNYSDVFTNAYINVFMYAIGLQNNTDAKVNMLSEIDRVLRQYIDV